MGHKKEAQYDLDVAQVLVEHAKYSISKRARINLLNHGYLPKETIEDVFAAIRCSHFYKSVELENRPNTHADIYRHVPCYGAEWYMKYFLDENGPVITIWSLKEDGYQF